VTKVVGGRPPTACTSRRAYAAAATSRQKRVLNQQQLEGSTKKSSSVGSFLASTPGVTAPTAAATTNAPSPTAATSRSGTISTSGGGGGGGSGGGAMFGVLAAVGAVGAGMAYYNGLIPGLGGDDIKEKTKKQEEPIPVAIAADDKSTSTEETESIADNEKKEDSLDSSPLDNGGAGPAEAGEVTDQDEMTDASTVAAMDGSTTAKKMDVVVAVVEDQDIPPKAFLTESKIMEELEKVKAQLNQESDRALTEAHSELAKLSILNLDNLDDMTKTQLKIRLVQLTKEMEDRTKWEAVRLQEFLLMKEREVEDKYVLRRYIFCAACLP
jgi:hypothetical protein